MAKLRELIEEAKRRKVFRVASWYLVTAWGASLGAAELFSAFHISAETTQLFIIGLFLGFPIAVILAWVYELTSHGLIKEPQGLSPRVDIPDEPFSTSETLTAQAPASELRMMWQDSDGTVRDEFFSKDFRIGRDPQCELQLDDPMISRLQAEMRFKAGCWSLRDAGSRNGTTLNGQFIELSELPPRGEIQFYERGPILRFEIQRPGKVTLITPKRLMKELGSG